ncbi:hypothetical protein UFOVP147_6 [uncultured Caudovirales phage]|uniref:Uncharacterized protein n=1 Tax=uncultured Caudovirales phage TaxID=2100421 RepID=A0A6J7W8S2_9CAUD|nr:hypothetical protein UFOVP147_6 [uncultured Caudovirales phage]
MNTAQQLLIALGVDHVKVMLGHHKEKSAQFCKKGPGRKHRQGGANV